MTSSLKFYYALLLLALVVVLAGCELQRDGGTPDLPPAGELPTLAPLGAEETAATPVPTAIAVQASAEEAAHQAAPAPPPTEPSLTSPVSTAGNPPPTVPEAFTPPAPPSTPEEKASEPAIIVEDMPEVVITPTIESGPIAVNPPVSPTTGDDTTPPTAPASGTHVVQAGETLFSLSQKYGVSVEMLISANSLTSDLVYIGQELIIPTAGASDPPETGSYHNTAHTVAAGETLFGIAARYGVSVEALANANGIGYPYLIQPGQELLIPPADNYYYPPAAGDGPTHTVAPGDTLFSLALRYDTTPEALAVVNGLDNPDQLYVGQELVIP
jgi:LysM repeat protein